MSPRLSVDLSESQPREPLPEGAYECKVFSISEVRKGDRSTYVEVQFEVTEGDFVGRRVYMNTPITGKGAGIFANLYQKLTGDKIEFGEGQGIDCDTDDLMGLPVCIAVRTKEYPEGSGEFNNEVRKVMRSTYAEWVGEVPF